MTMKNGFLILVILTMVLTLVFSAAVAEETQSGLYADIRKDAGISHAVS